jgi:hypothetical protein
MFLLIQENLEVKLSEVWKITVVIRDGEGLGRRRDRHKLRVLLRTGKDGRGGSWGPGVEQGKMGTINARCMHAWNIKTNSINLCN